MMPCPSNFDPNLNLFQNRKEKQKEKLDLPHIKFYSIKK